MAILGIMHIHVDSKVMEVIEHHMPISHSPCRRRSKGLLPSYLFRFPSNFCTKPHDCHADAADRPVYPSREDEELEGEAARLAHGKRQCED